MRAFARNVVAAGQRQTLDVLIVGMPEHQDKGQSYIFGSASGVQLGIYNKTLRAKATDKLDYWESVWKRRDSFDDQDPDNFDP